jgi:hypothetical protein
VPENTDQSLLVRSAGSGRHSQSISFQKVDEADFGEALLRFDRPPYMGGTRAGIAMAIAATLATIVAGIAMLCIALQAIVTSIPAGQSIKAIVAVACTPVGLAILGAGACGVRTLYYYARLPKVLRH